MKKENGKVITGIILSVVAFIALFLPLFTSYEIYYSYYGGLTEETYSYSPLYMLGEEDYSFVIIFILPILVGFLISVGASPGLFTTVGASSGTSTSIGFSTFSTTSIGSGAIGFST